MGLDEKLFGFLAQRWKTWAARRRANGHPRGVDLSGSLHRLGLIASAVAGHEVELGLHTGPMTIFGDRILLPRTLALLPSPAQNHQLALVSLTFAAAAVREHLSADDDAQWVAGALALETMLDRELPGWSEQRQQLGLAVLATRPALLGLRGRTALLEAVVQHRLGGSPEEIAAMLPVDLASLLREAWAPDSDLTTLLRSIPRAARGPGLEVNPLWGCRKPGNTSPRASHADAHSNPDADTPTLTERISRPRTVKRRRELEDPTTPENPLTHSFEKVHTAEEHTGGNKQADGSDELADHANALDDLDLEEVVLSGERTTSIYRADLSLFGSLSTLPADTQGLRYDEWDPSRQRYLTSHCRLQVEQPQADTAAGAALRLRVTTDHARVLQLLRDELHRVQSALRWSSRQADGPEIDLDAVIDRLSALAGGHDGGDRLYRSRRRRGHDVAMLLLVDASLSTDAWVDNRRVLDTARDAATLLLLALEPHVDELGLASFCSFSRDDCRFSALKGFSESANIGLSRIARLHPSGYTRIGPALRHGFASLLNTRARRRLLILLTDAKPTDTDHYEGRHGIGDVRQALREGRRVGVETFALAIDPRAAVHLPAMFGAQGYAGLQTVDDLARVATQIFALRRYS